MFEIDGSQKSGSGTLLRVAIALAAIKGEALHITNIRQNRPKAGLKPQHVESVLTAARLCNAETRGTFLNSKELWFKPHEITGGVFQAVIGTAGNIPMLLMTVLPICLFAREEVKLQVTKGGTDTSKAPTANYLRNVFLPALKLMGVQAELKIQRYGYYPKGNGEATLTVKPSPHLTPFRIETFGKIQKVKGVSVCTFLADRKVAERQAKAASQTLKNKGYNAEIGIVNDFSNPIQKGSSIALWAETDSGVVLGADAIGELGKTAEAVGELAAKKLLAELALKATVDANLADMLIPYVALSQARSSYLTRTASEHLESNIWLTEKLLGVHFKVNRQRELYKVEKLADA